MKIIILGGFLGAGKTTVLLQYARSLISHSTQNGNPVVILENEISEAGVDNQLLSRNHFLVKNIFSGCICCTSSVQLEQSVREIERNYSPEYLLIESTGMAYPDSVRRTLRDAGSWDTGIVALVDCKRWHKVKRAMPDLVTSQLKDASVILANKIDKVDENEQREVITDVSRYNSSARIFPISAIKKQPDELWTEITALCLGKG